MNTRVILQLTCRCVRITRDLNRRKEKETTKTMMLVACGWLYEKDLAYDESSLRVQQTECITHYFYSSISIPRVVLTKTDGSETRSGTATAGSEYLRTNKHTSVRKFTRFSAVRHFLNTWTQWRAAAGLYSSWHHNDLHCLKVHGEETEPKTWEGAVWRVQNLTICVWILWEWMKEWTPRTRQSEHFGKTEEEEA